MKLAQQTTHTGLQLTARTAGLLYLFIIVFGVSSEVLVRGSLIVTGNASATAANILYSQDLFRLGFVADAIMLISDVAIAILFYQLFKSVNQTLALMATAFRLIQAALLGFNLLNYYVALLLLNGVSYAEVFNADQLNAIAMLFLNMHSHGYDLGLIFFAFSSAILGYLLIKSNNFPCVLGYGLIAASVVYFTGSMLRFILPDYLSIIQPAYIIPLVAELGFCLWLLVKGISYKTVAA